MMQRSFLRVLEALQHRFDARRSVPRDQHPFHLHPGVLRQRSHPDRRPCWVGLVEVLGHHLVDERENREVRQVDVELHEVAEITAGGVGDGEEVAEDLVDLLSDV